MTPDLLDDLLDRSSPVTRAADSANLRAMISAASREHRRSRRRRIGLAAGALAALLVGGAGVATATDGFTWSPWLQDPLGSYSLTLPSGLECDVRIAHYTMPGDPLTTAAVNRIVEDWWRSTDVIAAGEALLPEMIADIRAMEQTVNLDTGEVVPSGYGTEFYDADWEYYLAWMNALGELQHKELSSHGYSADAGRLAGLEGGEQIQCLGEDGEVVGP